MAKWQIDIQVLETTSREPLRALRNALEHKLALSNVQVSYASRPGDDDTLGPIEVVTVLVAAGGLLLDIISAIGEWQVARRRERKELHAVRIELDNLEIDIRIKGDSAEGT